jgi:TPR repeat protein
MYKKTLLSKYVDGLKDKITKLESENKSLIEEKKEVSKENKKNEKLFTIIKQHVDNGHILLNHLLGCAYNEINDFESSIKYLKCASYKGFVAANFNLGVIYYKNNDIENAIKYFKLAQEKGYKMSHIWLDFIKKELEKQDLENPARKINCTKNNVEEKSEKKDEISLKRKCDNESIHSLTNDTKRAKIDDVYDDNDVIVID